MKEPEVTNIKSRLEVGEPDKPLFDNRDMCMVLSIICAAMITYLLFDKGILACNRLIPHALVVLSIMYVIAELMFWITQKVVRFCYIKAKRKADNKVD